MDRYALVMIGGAFGSLLRYMTTVFVTERFAGRFPAGTFTVNLSGSFLIGVFMAALAARSAHPNWRYLLVTGFLGGFTTFSSFEYEIFISTRLGDHGMAVLYSVVSVVLGLLAVLAGASVGSRL